MVTFFDDVITSKQNKCVKEAALLLRSKGRREAKMTRIDGVKLFSEAVSCGASVPRIFINADRSDEVLSSMDAYSPDWRTRLDSVVYMLSESAFSQITEEKSPEGVICLLKYLDKSEKSGTIIKKEFSQSDIIRREKPSGGCAIALEAIRDPGNLGTIIRTCLAFGITDIYLSSDCAEVTSPKVIRSSMGAVFAAGIHVCESLPDALAEMKKEGYRINAAALYGSPVLISDTPLTRRDVFVIGNEGHGLSDEVLSIADRCVIIDMRTGPGCESLNAATAASICAWEIWRRCKDER